ncbi:hypothetical protein CEUSTIGMA_g1015.t1 [Chlamydomonas eustigma]|uniref:histidine kinase n=1 Tax=Chlamydomonas eustigma TaxID=1157962 RepID=A0A250WRU2_9CHLO|nr:hypothetical protein CEUSTIGMA_g1015.t1 [Chlamydomonas eustigma]|eukprot:GAX73564.1 hypothetical protein CEUSTIGMA_g1015.t1 [Chlamydomonas eustigma]
MSHDMRPKVQDIRDDCPVITRSALTLCFHQQGLERQYLAVNAKNRWPILFSIFCFDVVCFIIRTTAKVMQSTYSHDGDAASALLGISEGILPQLGGMMALYTFLYLLNLRSRRLGDLAAKQLRWWVGTSFMALPVLLVMSWQWRGAVVQLPPDSVIHMIIAWGGGGFMAYLSEGYRRQMFASEQMAASAHQKELLEAKARIKAQRQLAAAQAQAAHRALTVTREKASNEAKSEFMSLMCHEVRTPLNGCLASAEMLLETPLQEEQRELAKTICVSGSILLSTVSNFLDFFKLEAGKTLDVVRTEVGLSHLIRDVHCIMEAMVGRGGGEVELLEPYITKGLPHHILCDPDRVRGVLLNLYTNAAKFTKTGHIGLRVQEVPTGFRPQQDDGCAVVATLQPPASVSRLRRSSTASSSFKSRATGGLGGSRIAGDRIDDLQPHMVVSEFMQSEDVGSSNCSVDFESERAAGPAEIPQQSEGIEASAVSEATAGEGTRSRWLMFEVFDSGIGIQPECLRSLFKEFVQGTEDEMRKPRSRGGTGLGLSICSKQVGVLGGHIGAHSLPGKGSTFWFTIPLIEAPEPSHSSQYEDDEHDALSLALLGDGVSHYVEPITPVEDVTLDSLQYEEQDFPLHQSGFWSNAVKGGQSQAGKGGDVEDGSSAARIALFNLATASSTQTSSSISTQVGVPCSPPQVPPSSPCSRITHHRHSSSLKASLDASQVDATVDLHSLADGAHMQYPQGRVSERGLLPSRDLDMAIEDQGKRKLSVRYSVDSSWPGASVPAIPAALLASRASNSSSGSHPSGLCGIQLAGHTSTCGRKSISADLIKGLKVLLVEDNIINQTVARKLLTSLGVECDVASNGLEAVEAVQKRAANIKTSSPPDSPGALAQVCSSNYDLILMDMSMPVMGGVEATRVIRKLPDSFSSRVPILAMTANASDKDRDECRAAGMDGFLCKPVLKDRLTEAMLQVMEGRAWGTNTA